MITLFIPLFDVPCVPIRHTIRNREDVNFNKHNLLSSTFTTTVNRMFVTIFALVSRPGLRNNFSIYVNHNHMCNVSYTPPKIDQLFSRCYRICCKQIVCTAYFAIPATAIERFLFYTQRYLRIVPAVHSVPVVRKYSFNTGFDTDQS